MALSRAEELLFSHLSILVPLFAPFAALESLFMAIFPIDPETPFRVFPRAGEYPDCPAGVPHLLALLVIMRIPQAVTRRSRAGGEEEEEEEGGGLAVRPRMRRANDGVLEDAGGRDDDVR
ncbi:uncharacterized protein BBA_07060 [Beauveria bassiana ARSEF 2860]|uniref:Uncharacterized protein n=1 Tax=Beauveria bassiana (strain ARSEF 2860) TaxID=655819 RepID=J4W0K1_BEAB2|nr:uncharacterized protein BBA_07060 [Beauveria bassiana ARSEF 2860]EJP64055.1 hypothetical protein BBA_07060 [Beauveria bassiana ARSEF 2860]